MNRGGRRLQTKPDTRESYVIVSDELQHGKMSVYAFMTHILTDLKQKYPTVQQIDVFSDGASSQFKQRFLFSNLQMWEQQFHIELKWHFFANQILSLYNQIWAKHVQGKATDFLKITFNSCFF